MPLSASGSMRSTELFAPSTWLALASLTFACQTATADRDDSPPEPPRRPTLDRDSMVRLHMQTKLMELRSVEHALVRGQLVDAKVSASAIANAPIDAELDEWKRKTAHVRELAHEVATAKSADDALRGLPAVAVACAECHVATGGWPKLARAPHLPDDGPGTVARMARHQWAVDRMWDGMIGGDEETWRAALTVLAATPPPYAITEADKVALGAELQRVATTALQHRLVDTLDDRGRQYGELLVTCAACHESHAKLGTKR